MSLNTKYNTRLKGLYRLLKWVDSELQTAQGKDAQDLQDEKTALRLAVRMMRDDPEGTMRKIMNPQITPPDQDFGERVRAAAAKIEEEANG